MLSKPIILTGVYVAHTVLMQRAYEKLHRRYDELRERNTNLLKVIERQNKQTRYLANLLDVNDIQLDEFDKIALTDIHEG